jgi:hypothetical protein
MAMSKARKIVEHFTKLTQQTAKLVNFQKESNLPIYSAPGSHPKKLLQDVITRWWSSYRMLKGVRFLKPALIRLYTAREITCEMMSENQWIVLEQIKITLKKTAMWQRIIERKNYQTGSLVVLAIYAIHVHYANVLSSHHAQEPVKSLTKILLQDFDKRYHPPAGNVGKVKFTQKPEIGERNRYTGVHPYFFIAAFLDPRTRKGLKKMMVPDQWKGLREMILDLMVGVALDKEKKSNGDDRYDNNNNYNEPTGTSSSAGLDFAFEGLYDDDKDDDNGSTTIAGTNINKESIRISCKHQLASY